MKNVLYWVFDCLFSYRLDLAVVSNVKVTFWTYMAIFLLDAIGWIVGVRSLWCNMKSTFVLECAVGLPFSK